MPVKWNIKQFWNSLIVYSFWAVKDGENSSLTSPRPTRIAPAVFWQSWWYPVVSPCVVARSRSVCWCFTEWSDFSSRCNEHHPSGDRHVDQDRFIPYVSNTGTQNNPSSARFSLLVRHRLRRIFSRGRQIRGLGWKS